MIKDPTYFLKFELNNIRSFKENASLDLSDGEGNWRRWTIILGDNGTGKTTLLQSLSLLEVYYNEDYDPNIKGSARTKYPNYEKIGKKFTIHYRDLAPIKSPRINTESASSIRAILHYNKKIGGSKYDFKSLKPFGDEYYKMNLNYDLFINFSDGGVLFGGNYYFKQKRGLSIYAYGANREIGSTKLSDNLNSNNNETLFNDDAKLINAEEWLLQLDYAASKESEVKELAIKKREQVKNVLIDLLPGIEEIRFSSPTKSNFVPSVEFRTSFGWVSIDELSLGYKTMVAWMVDLTARMFERYPESINPIAEPAIVLVDEIDLHLHPKWQRKIYSYLTKKFPKTQFIVTAHSPLVVQSAPEDANIVLLRKVGDSIRIDNDINSVENWRLDQILSSDLFGIESLRSIETENLLNERKKLLQKGYLTVEEKAHLDELNKYAHSLPVADNEKDIRAMEIIRRAAEYYKNNSEISSDDKN